MQITEQLMVARKTLLDLNEELASYRIYFMGDKFREDTTVQVHEILSRIISLKDQVETALESVTMPFKIEVPAGALNPGDKVFLTEDNETLDYTCTYVGQDTVLFEYTRMQKGEKIVKTARRKIEENVWKAID